MFQWLFNSWPKRLPEGKLIKVVIPQTTIFLCGENHPRLDQRGKEGMVLQNFMWLKGYRRKDGKLTIYPVLRNAGHELQHLLNYANPEIVDPDLEA